MIRARSLIIIIVALCLMVFGGATFLFMGGYNVAATVPHSAPMRWLLHSTMHRSVHARAESINAPTQFTQEQVRDGFEDFDEMCVACHGAPGKERGEIGKGLNPPPPDLSETISEWPNAEVFWILKNGIKMSGMPAFGPTHSDDRLWSIVAFVKGLPQMTPKDYKNLEDARPQKPPDEEHKHP